MQSHTYQFKARDCAAILAPLAVCALFVCVAHFTAWTGLLPRSAPSEFVEDIIVQEKLKAARKAGDIDVLFVGDSSCLMDFSARAFEELAPATRVYNLGTMSTLGLEKFAEFCRLFFQSEHTNIQTVVVLLSPEMVAAGSFEAPAPKLLPAKVEAEFRRLRMESKRLTPDLEKDWGRLTAAALAIPLIKTQIVARVFETPLPGSFGNEYGFPQGLHEHLRREKGSAIDPTDHEPKHVSPRGGGAMGKGFIGEKFRTHCEALRRAVPRRVRLLVGLTPIPDAGAKYRQTFQKTLAVLQGYFQADGILTNLPATFPAQCFSTATHLNAHGARQYTRALATALRAETQRIVAQKLERNTRSPVANTAQGSAGALGLESGNASP